VESMEWAKLSALDMGSWFSPFLYGGERMIRLQDLFAQFGEAFVYHVEIKGRAPDLVPATHALIQSFGLAEHCVVTSFHLDALIAMRAESAHMRLGWLVEDVDAHARDQAAALSLHQLCPRAANVTPAMVADARTVVPEVRAWGLLGDSVRDEATQVQALIARVLDAGCDGMTINWPDWVRHG
jgi:glycerophosphoryl diester phosphodiesterase